MGEEARRKPTHDQPPSFWVFPCFTVSVSLTVSGTEKLEEETLQTLSLHSDSYHHAAHPRSPPTPTAVSLRFWHTERIASQAFSRLLVKA